MSAGLIPREKIVELAPSLAKAIIDRQQVEYQDIREDLDADTLAYFEGRLDHPEFADPTIAHLGQLKISVAQGGVEALQTAFADLLDKLHINELIFIPVYRDAWLGQKNTYPPVKKALKHINAIVPEKTYNEGILASDKDIAKLFLSVFWITRCNAAMCEIFFAAPKSGIVFSLCKYCIIYLNSYGIEDKEMLPSILSDSAFIEVDLNHDIFNESAISGRQTIPQLWGK